MSDNDNNNNRLPTPPEGALNLILHTYGVEMLEDAAKWFGAEVAQNLTVLVLGLCGESGEVADVIKKVMRTKDPLEGEVMDQLHEELIDVFIYWAMTIALLQVDIESVYARKRKFNEERFNNAD